MKELRDLIEVSQEELALAIVGLHPLQIAWDKEKDDNDMVS